ncbi:hypothetical protein [Mesorhizobium sp.]|uniref:hypothetical protein n=1 Tax=Mesorhizobium sp. TaxID=1871066 RepID=UPI0025FFBCFA|nr:hypothetical protein [Mesorhizobium sp.]
MSASAVCFASRQLSQPAVGSSTSRQGDVRPTSADSQLSRRTHVGFLAFACAAGTTIDILFVGRHTPPAESGSELLQAQVDVLIIRRFSDLEPESEGDMDASKFDIGDIRLENPARRD